MIAGIDGRRCVTQDLAGGDLERGDPISGQNPVATTCWCELFPFKCMIRQGCPCLLLARSIIRIHKTLVKQETMAGVGDGGVNGKDMCIGNVSRDIEIASEH